MALNDFLSLSWRYEKVWSEKTIPQPNVSFGASRSRTVTSCERSSFFIRIAKYNPDGPPPMMVIFIIPLRRATSVAALVSVALTYPGSAATECRQQISLRYYRECIRCCASRTSDSGRIEDQGELVDLSLRKGFGKFLKIQIL